MMAVILIGVTLEAAIEGSGSSMDGGPAGSSPRVRVLSGMQPTHRSDRSGSGRCVSGDYSVS